MLEILLLQHVMEEFFLHIAQVRHVKNVNEVMQGHQVKMKMLKLGTISIEIIMFLKAPLPIEIKNTILIIYHNNYHSFNPYYMALSQLDMLRRRQFKSI